VSRPAAQSAASDQNDPNRRWATLAILAGNGPARASVHAGSSVVWKVSQMDIAALCALQTPDDRVGRFTPRGLRMGVMLTAEAAAEVQE